MTIVRPREAREAFKDSFKVVVKGKFQVSIPSQFHLNEKL